MSQARQTNELQAIAHKAFEDLLIHTFMSGKVGNLERMDLGMVTFTRQLFLISGQEKTSKSIGILSGL
jgi:hypothetical protein